MSHISVSDFEFYYFESLFKNVAQMSVIKLHWLPQILYESYPWLKKSCKIFLVCIEVFHFCILNFWVPQNLVWSGVFLEHTGPNALCGSNNWPCFFKCRSDECKQNRWYRINDKLNSRIHISNQFIKIIKVAQWNTINFYNYIIICCTNMCIFTLLLIFET